jgi:purine-binding chemotaxis protein CheW
MAETLQQALRSLGGERQGSGTASGLTPEMLNELARRAGLSPVGSASVAGMLSAGGLINDVDVTGTPQHIIFALDDAECALPAECVQGVERIAEISPVPNTVSWVLGIIHLRGSIRSVVDLRAFFDLPTQVLTPRSRLLGVTQRDMTIGLLVDGVNAMRSLDGLPSEEHGASTPSWAASYAERTVSVEGRTIVLLDPERLLYAEKMHRYRTDFA